jgi:hypothetical protein
MQKTMTVLLMLGRLLFLIQLIVGLALWFHVLTSAVGIHMMAGSLFVLVLWIISLIALFALPVRGLALFGLLWGGVVLWFGMAQVSMLVGSAHWAIRLAHLLIGFAAMGLLETLAKAVKRHKAAQATA